MKKLLLCSLIVACCSANAYAGAGLATGTAGTTVATTTIDYDATTPTLATVFTSTVKKGSDAGTNDILVTTQFLAPAAGDYCVAASYSGSNSASNIGVAAATNATGYANNNCFTGALKDETLYINNYAKGTINPGLTHIILTLTNKAA